jgi:glycosyltransferase involved in cell wall biosynthesis
MTRNINILAPVNNLGYGVASINICNSLSKRGVSISLFPIGQPSFSSQQEADSITPLLHAQGSFDCTAPCLKIWHEHLMGERIGKGKFVGFPFFEVNKFDAPRKTHLSSCDEIIVASEWAKEIVEREVPSSVVHTVPLGVDTSIFSVATPPPSDKFIFFNCGKWEKRKGHDLLIFLFKEAFKNESDVELWMMCHNSFLSPEQDAQWKDLYRQDPRVRFIDRVQSQPEVAAIMNAVDCGIFPSRAEGWNLEILELMGAGKHIITTNYSAHTEFCNDKNSMLVTPLQNESAIDGMFFNGFAEWASLEGVEEEFVTHMQNIYKQWKKNGNQRIVNKEGLKTAEEFSWDATAKKIENILYDN